MATAGTACSASPRPFKTTNYAVLEACSLTASDARGLTGDSHPIETRRAVCAAGFRASKSGPVDPADVYLRHNMLQDFRTPPRWCSRAPDNGVKTAPPFYELKTAPAAHDGGMSRRGAKPAALASMAPLDRFLDVFLRLRTQSSEVSWRMIEPPSFWREMVRYPPQRASDA